ncbi:hypothetical protein H6501_02970 [Candidatus Woesearchaeota archaeon]|nr:hypothetical protein [Nanoarchaeota archaeon]MCB9370532.1 hypothetical protein [Candidatus Woesearchaeota archaeon]USN43608.1 MAG: hypothetical protein H6500_04415 [Candidatus Woesearchaeota archaeon]
MKSFKHHAQNLAYLLLLFGFFSIASLSVSAVQVELVKTDPAPVLAGDYADITLRVTNTDLDNVKNFEASISGTPFILPLNDNKFSLSVLQAGESATKTLRVYFSEDLPQGTVRLPILLSYESTTTKQYVDVFVEDAASLPDLRIGTVRSTPSELLPDSDDNDLELVLQNLGDRDATLVSASLVTDESLIKPSFSYSFEDAVSQIANGEEASLSFAVDVDKNARGEIPAQLKLRYRAEKAIGNSYDTYEKVLNFTIDVADAPYLEVVSVKPLSSFEVGSSDNKIELTIKNVGEEDAREVRVRAVPDASYPFSYEQTTEYVASKIKAGETATLVFTVEVLSSAEVREYPTTLLLESLMDETRYTQEGSMDIAVKAGKQSSNTQIGGLVLAFIVIVSVVLGAMRYLGAKKKSK